MNNPKEKGRKHIPVKTPALCPDLSQIRKELCPWNDNVSLDYGPDL
ncbi:MAG: hypothetical protein IH591_06635 [Bacteroidales bacterium]|nr:hypothetical protein [Bacteroidales bacterium]